MRTPIFVLFLLACFAFPWARVDAGEPIPTDPAAFRAWIVDRISELQPKPEEKRLDDIGWADDIRHALRLAKLHQRPVFLFTHDGRIHLGRC